MIFSVSYDFDKSSNIYRAFVSCKMNLQEVKATLSPKTYVLNSQPHVFSENEYKFWSACSYFLNSDIDTLSKQVNDIIDKTVEELKAIKANNLLLESKVPPNFSKEIIF